MSDRYQPQGGRIIGVISFWNLLLYQGTCKSSFLSFRRSIPCCKEPLVGETTIFMTSLSGRRQTRGEDSLHEAALIYLPYASNASRG